MNIRNQRKVFIGSSAEGIPVMNALHAQFEFDEVIRTVPWTTAKFKISETTLDSLENFLEEYDYAVLIFTPDDYVSKRDEDKKAPRDNVLFEFGLFLGRFGRHRTFVVRPRNGENLHIPTDLKGLSAAEYTESEDQDELKINLSHTAGKIKSAIDNYERKKVRRARKFFDQEMAQIKEDFKDTKTKAERMDIVLGGLRSLLSEKSVIMDLSLDDILTDIMLFTSCFLDFLDPAQLANHQHSNLSEVWVYAPKPLEIYDENIKLREQVCRNIINGVAYMYFVDSEERVDEIMRLVGKMAEDSKNRIKKSKFLKHIKIVQLEPHDFLTYITIHICDGKAVDVIQSVLTKQRKDILIKLPDSRAKVVYNLIDGLVKKCAMRNVKDFQILRIDS